MAQKPTKDNFFQLGKKKTKSNEKDSSGKYDFFRGKIVSSENHQAKPEKQSGFFAPLPDKYYYDRGLIPPLVSARHEYKTDNPPTFSSDEITLRKGLAYSYTHLCFQRPFEGDSEYTDDSFAEMILTKEFHKLTTEGIRRRIKIKERQYLVEDLLQIISRLDNPNQPEKDRSFDYLQSDALISNSGFKYYGKTKGKSKQWIRGEISRLENIENKRKQAQKQKEVAEKKQQEILQKKEDKKREKENARKARIDAKKAKRKQDKTRKELEQKIKETKKKEEEIRKANARGKVRGSLFVGSDFYQQQLDNFNKYGSTTRPLQFDAKRVNRAIEIYSEIHCGNTSDFLN